MCENVSHNTSWGVHYVEEDDGAQFEQGESRNASAHFQQLAEGNLEAVNYAQEAPLEGPRSAEIDSHDEAIAIQEQDVDARVVYNEGQSQLDGEEVIIGEQMQMRSNPMLVNQQEDDVSENFDQFEQEMSLFQQQQKKMGRARHLEVPQLPLRPGSIQMTSEIAKLFQPPAHLGGLTNRTDEEARHAESRQTFGNETAGENLAPSSQPEEHFFQIADGDSSKDVAHFGQTTEKSAGDYLHSSQGSQGLLNQVQLLAGMAGRQHPSFDGKAIDPNEFDMSSSSLKHRQMALRDIQPGMDKNQRTQQQTAAFNENPGLLNATDPSLRDRSSQKQETVNMNMMTDSSGNFLSAMGQSQMIQHSPKIVLNTIPGGNQFEGSQFGAALDIQIQNGNDAGNTASKPRQMHGHQRPREYNSPDAQASSEEEADRAEDENGSRVINDSKMLMKKSSKDIKSIELSEQKSQRSLLRQAMLNNQSQREFQRQNTEAYQFDDSHLTSSQASIVKSQGRQHSMLSSHRQNKLSHSKIDSNLENMQSEQVHVYSQSEVAGTALNFKNDGSQQMFVNNQMDVSLGPQQQLYQIENFHTFNGDQSQASSQHHANQNHEVKHSNDFAYMDRHQASPNDSHEYGGLVDGNTRPPPTSMNSDQIHLQQVQHNRMQLNPNAVPQPYNNISGSGQNESSMMRNFYSHKTRITKQTQQSQDSQENYQDFKLSQQTEEQESSDAMSRSNSVVKNNARMMEMTDYDSLIPFGTAESANKMARANVDSSNQVVQQLSSRVIYLQTMFKSIELLHFFANKKLKTKNAFLRFKMNVQAQKTREVDEENKRSQSMLAPLKKESQEANQLNETLKEENEKLERLNQNLKEENQMLAEQKKREADDMQRMLQSSSTIMLERLESEKQLIESQFKNENQQLQLKLKSETQDLLLKNNEEKYMKQRLSQENDGLTNQIKNLQAENEKLLSINKELLGIINQFRSKQESAKVASCQTEEQTNEVVEKEEKQEILEEVVNQVSHSAPSRSSFAHSDSKAKSFATGEQQPAQISEFFLYLQTKVQGFLNSQQKNNEEKPQRVNKAMKLHKAEGIMKDMLRAIDMIYGYCDLLDKVKDINLRRAEKLEQMEVNLFSREVDSASETNKNYVSLNPTQPNRILKNQTSQTFMNIASMVEQKYRSDSLADQLEIKKFKLQEYFDQLEKNFIVSEKQIEVKRQDLLKQERELDLQQHDLKLQQKKINEYPLNCLKSNQNIVDYIAELYKEMEKKLDEGQAIEPNSASLSHDGMTPQTAQSREDMTFLNFLKIERNQNLLTKMKALAPGRLKAFKDGSVDGSESRSRDDVSLSIGDPSHLMISRMYQVLRIEYETMKDRAHVHLVVKDLERQRQEIDEKQKNLDEKDNAFQMSKALHQKYHDDISRLQLKEKEFSRLIDTVCQRFEKLTDGLEVEGINYRLQGDDHKHKSQLQIQNFIEKYQAYVRDLDLKQLEDDAFLQDSDNFAAMKEPFVKHLFLDHKLSKFESLMREKSFKRMISFEDLQKSLDGDQIQKLLLQDAAHSALNRDLSNSKLDQGNESAHQRRSSHLYNQFLNRKAVGENSFTDLDELFQMLRSKRTTEAQPAEVNTQMFTLGKVHSSKNVFKGEDRQAIKEAPDKGMKSAPQRSPKGEDSVLMDSQEAERYPKKVKGFENQHDDDMMSDVVRPRYADPADRNLMAADSRVSITERVLQTLGNIDKLNIVKQAYSLPREENLRKERETPPKEWSSSQKQPKDELRNPNKQQQEAYKDSTTSTDQKIADQIKILEQKEQNIESLKKIIIKHTVQLEQSYSDLSSKEQLPLRQKKQGARLKPQEGNQLVKNGETKRRMSNLTTVDDKDTHKTLLMPKHQHDDSSTFDGDRGHLKRVTTAKSFAINHEKYLQPDHNQASNSELHGNAPEPAQARQLTQCNSARSQSKDRLAMGHQSSMNTSSVPISPFSGPGSKARLPPLNIQNKINNQNCNQISENTMDHNQTRHQVHPRYGTDMANIFYQPSLVLEADQREDFHLEEERIYQQLQEQYRQELEDDQWPQQNQRRVDQTGQQSRQNYQLKISNPSQKGQQSLNIGKNSRYATEKSQGRRSHQSQERSGTRGASGSGDRHSSRSRASPGLRQSTRPSKVSAKQRQPDMIYSFGVLPTAQPNQRLSFKRTPHIEEEDTQQYLTAEQEVVQFEPGENFDLPMREEVPEVLVARPEPQSRAPNNGAQRKAAQQHFYTQSNRQSTQHSRRGRRDLDINVFSGVDLRSKSYDAAAGDLNFLENMDPEFPIYNHKQQQMLLKQMWAREEELKVKQQQLQLREAELKDIKAQLLEQLKALNQQKEDMKMMETEMNQQKLKMLVKFDKIKYLEDFYNQQKYRENFESGGSQPADQINLYIEIDDDEMARLAEKMYLNNAKKIQLDLQRKHWALQGLQAMFKRLLRKKLQTNYNKTLFNFYFWRTQSMKKVNELHLVARRQNVHFAEQNIEKRDIDILKESIITENISDKYAIDRNTFSQGGAPPSSANTFSFVNPSEANDQVDLLKNSFREASAIQKLELKQWERESVYWNKMAASEKYLGLDLRQLSGANLAEAGNRFQRDVKLFHRYKEKSLLGLMFLHQRRRARMLIYFAFQKYKQQVYKLVIAELIQKQELSLPGAAGPISAAFASQELTAAIPADTYSAEMIANSNVVKLFEKHFPAIKPSEASLQQQDQMLDQVFAVANKSGESFAMKEADLGTYHSNTKKGFVTLGGHASPSPLTMTLRHQVGIKHRLLSILHIRVMTTYKRESKLTKSKFFVRWRSCCLIEQMRDLKAENERQRDEIEKIKLGWSRAMQSFGQQKSEFEGKLHRMAVLIQEKLLEKQTVN